MNFFITVGVSCVLLIVLPLFYKNFYKDKEYIKTKNCFYMSLCCSIIFLLFFLIFFIKELKDKDFNFTIFLFPYSIFFMVKLFIKSFKLRNKEK
jgi:hypothetical protein